MTQRMGRVSILWALLALALIIWLSTSPWVWAQSYDDRNNDGDVSVNTTVTSDSVVSNKTRALALSGADMEINDCLATYSALFGIWQSTKVNPMCEAARFNAQGQYQAAAEMKCSTWKYRRVYGKGQACIDAVILTIPQEPPKEPPEGTQLADLYNRAAQFDDHAQREEEHYDQLEVLEQQIMEQREQLTEQKVQFEEWEARVSSYEAPAAAPFITDAKRKALEELRNE